MDYLIPFRAWPTLDWAMLRGDLEAGAIGALSVLPQAISLAMLAGMSVEYGIYTSIVPVMALVIPVSAGIPALGLEDVSGAGAGRADRSDRCRP